MPTALLIVLTIFGSIPPSATAECAANLLRNPSFQDDWLTLLPENKNHHWCYGMDFYNRRDFNPDGWICHGSWEWLHDHEPAGNRRIALRGPSAELVQRVNWVAVNDDRKRGGFPDAGGFPLMEPQRSTRPSRVVRDLTLRVLVSGSDVPPNAGGIEVGLCPPEGINPSDPLGTSAVPTVLRSAPFPTGSFDERWLTVSLRAQEWLEAVRSAKDDPSTAKLGPLLPLAVQVALRYRAKEGRILVHRAELIEAGSDAPNLLPHGDFEALGPKGEVAGWSAPEKYRYFPPLLYYIFNTWHNAQSENRGPVGPDTLVAAQGARSLKMVVPSGDEVAVVADAITLNQAEARLIEVQAWIKTDCLAFLQIDAVDEQGRRLDGFNFIHKAPVSIGTDDWRSVRQVFRPRQPVKEVRLMLCARGVNGCTLDDTSSQPQNNVVGTIWWDDVRLFEPESTPDELTARGVKPWVKQAEQAGPHLGALDLGERLLGENILRGTIANPGPARSFVVRWEFTSPTGKATRRQTAPLAVAHGEQAAFTLPYELVETCPSAYTEYRGKLSLLDETESNSASSTLWFGTWTTPIDLELGALYLRPEQRQFVRINLGYSATAVKTLDRLRLEVVRRGTGKVLKDWEIRDLPNSLREQRAKIPVELREDFRNLLLGQFDVSFLPLQPFADPQRNWIVRATLFDAQGSEVARVDSPPFCRQEHDARQGRIRSVAIQGHTLLVNDRPWMPWGAVYGFVPVYPGPAEGETTAFRDLHNLPAWNLYDRFTAAPYSRQVNDFNCVRSVAGSVADPAALEKRWREDNLYASSAFVAAQPAFSLAELVKQGGGEAKLRATIDFCRKAPMVVSVAPGIEEVFGLFQGATREQLRGLDQVVQRLRAETGKPVMVGHGGYWNRFEFEKVPFFDVFDPETEPLYPADLHTDLSPLIENQNKVIWLRPQMYEDVPYERWRFHTYVELMRGCRGWQIAHGPGDESLFRGLHGELEFFRPIAASTDPGPDVTLEPNCEHWTRRVDGKLYLIAATTHGIPFGSWHSARATPVTEAGAVVRVTGGVAGEPPMQMHGLQNLPSARRWLRGSRLLQWVWVSEQDPPRNLVILAKADGRWTHAAAWGDARGLDWRANPERAYMFLKSFYRQADGFLGWDDKLVPTALDYVPKAPSPAQMPAARKWVRLEVRLDDVGASDQLLDGVGFLHDGGEIYWGSTILVGPDGRESVVWGDSIALPTQQRARVRVRISGVRGRTPVRVLFEDRSVTAENGVFEDDFRGQDLYQRYGGEGAGYGPSPVSLHAYEVALP